MCVGSPVDTENEKLNEAQSLHTSYSFVSRWRQIQDVIKPDKETILYSYFLKRKQLLCSYSEVSAQIKAKNDKRVLNGCRNPIWL